MLGLKAWWARYKDGRNVRKKERSYIATATLMLEDDYPDWNVNNKNALGIYLKAMNEYKDTYDGYVERWGREPRVEKPLLIIK